MVMLRDQLKNSKGIKKKSSVSQIIQSISKNGNQSLFVDEKLSFSVVTDLKEKINCMELAYQEYIKKDYIPKSDGSGFEQMKTIYDEFDRSIVFKAERQHQLVGTVTIIWDSDLGLPLDEEFPEVNNLFPRGVGQIAEVTRLAIKEGIENSNEIISGLFNAVTLDLITGSECQCLLIEVNPRHQFFYKKKMLFKPLVESRPCKRVAGAPAVLLSLSKDDCFYAYSNASKDVGLKRTLYKNFKIDKDVVEQIKCAKAKLN